MKPEHIKWNISQGVGTITLNRPEKFNAFSGQMRQDLIEIIGEAGSDRNVKVVIITGSGKAFCAGGDVGEIAEGKSSAQTSKPSAKRHDMGKAVLAINTMEKPVIASVNGIAAGGGCNLALGCDIILASDRARFAQVFVKRGLHPDWGGIYFLPRLVGYTKAAELIFTGRIIDALESLEIGLVNHVIPHEKLMDQTRKMAEEIAQNAPIPIAFAKRGLQNFSQWNLAQAIDHESYAQEICMKTRDMTEGFKAFLEKRQPEFKGE